MSSRPIQSATPVTHAINGGWSRVDTAGEQPGAHPGGDGAPLGHVPRDVHPEPAVAPVVVVPERGGEPPPAAGDERHRQGADESDAGVPGPGRLDRTGRFRLDLEASERRSEAGHRENPRSVQPPRTPYGTMEVC